MRHLSILFTRTDVPALLCSASLVWFGCAGTGETPLPGPNQAHPYTILWPGAAVDLGTDSDLPYARVTTGGEGGATVVTNQTDYEQPLDAREHFIKAWVRVDRIDRLGGLELRLSSDRFSGYTAIAVPMFTDSNFNVLRDDVWTPITFSFGSARTEGFFDRGSIDSVGWYVADRGEGDPVQVSFGEMSLVEQPREAIVSLTFDDGYDEHYEAALRMAQHGFAGTAYVIPHSVGLPTYVTREQLDEMQERFGWDIAAHHETPLTDFSPQELEQAMRKVQDELRAGGYEAGGHLAYPLGRQEPQVVRPLIRRMFTTARVAGAGPETFPPADPHLLRVVNVTPATTPEALGERVRRAQEHKEWLILMFHYLVSDPAKSDLEYTYDDFERALQQIADTGVRVLPVARAWKHCPRIAAAGGSACQFQVPAAADR